MRRFMISVPLKFRVIGELRESDSAPNVLVCGGPAQTFALVRC